MSTTVALSLLALGAAVFTLSRVDQPEVAGVQVAGSCSLAQVAFCDTFDNPAPNGNRSGQLDGAVWGVSRLIGGENLGQGQWNSAAPTSLVGCSGTTTVKPGTADVIACGGQIREATNDQTGVTNLAMYVKQPFDFAGRTGSINFDVSNDEPGIHTDWPELWVADQPVPVPFTHGASWLAVPRNGFVIRFAGGGCSGNGALWSVDSAMVVRNYVPDGSSQPGENPQPGAVAVQNLGCVTKSNGMAGSMNHIEVKVSQNQIDVWATDAGTTSPLKHISVIPNLNLSMTRGLVWIEDVHYNSSKDGGHMQHTFAWDNVGFDGPVLPRDLAFDVLDGTGSVQNYPGLVNLGWNSGPGSGPTLSIPGVFGMANATAAVVTLNFMTPTQPTTLTVTLNGHVHAVTPSLPPGSQSNGGFSPGTYAVVVPIGDVVAGTNTVHLSTNQAGIFANVDLVLVGAGGIAGGPKATNVPVSTATALPVSTATAIPVSTATMVPSPTAVSGTHTCTTVMSMNGTPTTYTRPLSACTNQ